MKAVFIEQYGGPDVLKYGDWPDPVAGAGEVVIDVVAASVNGADWKVRVGQHKQPKFPFVLGRDFSGVISAVGEGVADLAVGDAVFGVCDAGHEGAYAEKIAVRGAIVARKPDGLSHVDAAALALTGLTAMSAIEDTLQLRAGGENPDPGRRRRSRQLRHPACQAYRRPCHYDGESDEPCLSA